MPLFESEANRRIRREMKVRQAMRQLQKNLKQQDGFQAEYIAAARKAREIGDQAQYAYLRGALKKTMTATKLLQRQLLAIQSALMIKKQAEANHEFAQSMGALSKDISRLFGATDLEKTEANWERAMAQAETMEERMNLFLEGVEGTFAAEGVSSEVSDEDIDRLVQAEVAVGQKKELDELDQLRAEIAKERGSKEASR
jgi:cysteinyl-tRNA synthetase